MKVYLDRASTLADDVVGAGLELDTLDTLALSRSAVTIGNFDGVHEGHRYLIARTRELAASVQGPALAVTFDPHPARFFRPETAPPRIDTPRQKLRALAATGLDAVVVLPFDRDLAQLTPRAFVEQILQARLGARHVVVGKTFVFGHQRAGTIAVLESLGRELGFSAHGLEPLGEGDRVISSTRIREAIAAGEVEDASRWLKRPFSLWGRVATGAGRGRTIGIPTANLEAENDLQPANGVYAGLAQASDEEERWPTVINIGRAPTFERDRAVKVEAHLLDYHSEPVGRGELVGRELELAFIARLRDEQRFAGVDALIAQIHRDIANARQRLALWATAEAQQKQPLLVRGGSL